MKTFLMCLAAGSLGGLLTSLVPAGHAVPKSDSGFLAQSKDGNSKVFAGPGASPDQAGLWVTNGHGHNMAIVAEKSGTWVGFYDKSPLADGCTLAVQTSDEGVVVQFHDKMAPAKSPARYVFASVKDMMDALAPKKKD